MQEEDILLSKMSYTDKDFASMYPDLLDLAKQLTNKWDPSLSNESDPGVVLLKEGAFVADHVNYNIDKNVLENFLPTATQESSVRNILELNGYTPEYYISASGNITFNYKPSETDANFTSFSIPEFSVVITDSEESVYYTQVSAISITDENIPVTAKFMEGTINTLTVNGSETILLENLDDYNRVYFPDKFVAENGIFIKNVVSTQEDNDYWEKKDYILTQPLNSKVYKVGYDSKLGVPFIEFPSDIANIIGNGLVISYITTSGEQGNVKANTLTAISTPTSFTISDDFTVSSDDFEVTNASSIMNGKDPETIDEMYRSFMKVVGTFDTLVTCKDYSNAIYNATDGTNKFVSNAVVTDRNNDYNNAFKVISYDKYGEYFEYASKLLNNPGFDLKTTKPVNPTVGDIIYEDNMFKRYEGNNLWKRISHISFSEFLDTIETMTPYDLCIYALKAFSLSDYISSKPANAMENSFKPADDEALGLVSEYINSNNKCISHDFIENKDGDVICFKNYVPLNIVVTPYSKVTSQEKSEIIDNIYKALTKNFNAAEVDFGEELNYDSVLEVLLNCDDRIKNIRLADFEYNPKAMVKDSTTSAGYKEVELYSSEGSEILLDIVAKNVLAGRLCLFNFDDEFVNKYGQIETKTYNDIGSIQTEVTISSSDQTEETYTNTSETSRKIYHTVNSIVTKIAITGTSESATNVITIGSLEEYILPQDEILYFDIAGVVEEYSADDDEHEIIIVNNTDDVIQITYTGTTKSWVDMPEGYVTLIQRTTAEDINTYDLVYTPKANEYIEIAYNNYMSDAIFPTYVKYRFVGHDDSVIPANSDYILKSYETLIFVYTENDIQKSIKYTSGDVIKSNFKIVPTDQLSTTTVVSGVENYEAAKFSILTSAQQIEHRVLMLTQLKTAGTPCYWIVNNNSNTLFYDASSTHERTNEVILSSGEYFIYTNATKDSMIILGPGSLLRRSVVDNNNWTITNKLTYKDIETNGFNASIDWKLQDFSGNNTFEHQELNIITLTEGDELKIADWESASAEVEITNDWLECNGNITYTAAGEEVNLGELPEGEEYRIRSRLDISIDNENGQQLLDNQKFIITYSDGTEETIIGSTNNPICLQSSMTLDLYGDSSINISDYTSDTSVLDFKQYKEEQPKLYTTNYVAQYTGAIDTTQTYYHIEDNLYQEIDSSTVEAIASEFTYFSHYYASNPTDIWYIITEDSEGGTETSTTLTENNDTYVIDVNNPGRAEFKLGYTCEYSSLSDDHKEYILPVFMNYGDIDVTASIESSDSTLNVQLKEFNTSSPSDTITLNSTEMYLLQIYIDVDVPEGETKTISTNLTLTLKWEGVSSEPEIITVFNPVITNGVNTNLGGFTLDEILAKMKDLIDNSTKPNVKPYYIYKPENSIAIQDPDILDPAIFWDTNNVVNCLTIPQIDINTMADKDNPTVDIIKSMRNY